MKAKLKSERATRVCFPCRSESAIHRSPDSLTIIAQLDAAPKAEEPHRALCAQPYARRVFH
jgi:hypothetical protein